MLERLEEVNRQTGLEVIESFDDPLQHALVDHVHLHDVVALGEEREELDDALELRRRPRVDVGREVVHEDDEVHAEALLREEAAEVVLRPGVSVRGERANFTRIVLGCIEAKFCK